MKRLITISLMSASLALLSGCHHKDLDMFSTEVSELYVRFDWRDAPDANPASMALYLYDENGATPIRYIFDNKDGGEIHSTFGLHHAICINSDNTDWARIRHLEDIENMEIYTQDAATLTQQGLRSASVPRAEGTESERVAATPGMLWSNRQNDINLVKHSGRQVITMYPKEVVCHYTVDVLNVKNLSEVVAETVDATISGMAEGYNHGADKATDTPVTMTFTLLSDPEADTLHGEFLTFGECAYTQKQHYLSLYLLLNDGTKWYKTFDVTNQVAEAPDPRHVHIIVSGAELPKSTGNPGSIFETDVNGWVTENIDLDMKPR